MRKTQRHLANRSRNLSLRRSITTTLTIFMLCALALMHLNLATPGVQVAVGEEGGPPCPGGCPSDSADTLGGLQPTVVDEPVNVIPWYFSLLTLAL